MQKEKLILLLLQRNLKLLKLILEEKLAELDDLGTAKSKLLKEESEIDSEFKSIKAIITEKELKQNSLRKERETVSEEIHYSEIKLNELSLMIKNLLENIKENYSLTLEPKDI